MNKAGAGKLLLCILIFILGISFISPMAFAEVPYSTYTKDSYGKVVSTQPSYYPAGVIGKSIYIPDPQKKGKLLFSPMTNPQDIFIDSKDEIYIADTGNNRIVHFDAKGKLLRVIETLDNPLSKPEGVFVTDAGEIYIADTGNHRIVKLSKEGKFLQEFLKPVSKFVPEDLKFDPIKVIVDKRGMINIVTLGGYRGLMQLNPQGQFESFFGTNQTTLSIADALKKMFYSKKMYARELSKLPSSISNVTLDKNGFIHTVSGGDISDSQVKRFNIRGKNLLSNKDNYALSYSNSYGETIEGKGKPQLFDIAVDLAGNMTVIDSAFKFISQYDQGGNLLFFWAGNSSPAATQLGLIKNPISLAVNSRNELYVLDNQASVIQQFRLTEFGALVNQANELTNDGKYVESEAYWNKVLRLNSQYDLALLGLAKAAYKKEEYTKAMELFKQSGNQRGYSDAFWQIRLQWFQKHFSTAINISLIIGLIYAFFVKFAKKISFLRAFKNRRPSNNPIIVQLKHVFYLMKHPIDGFTGIRYEGKGSYASAVIIIILVYVSLCLSKLYTSFTFNRTLSSDIDLLSIFSKFFFVWILWVVANYLTSSIYRGEGTFKSIFISSAYCLIPYVVIGIPVTVLSNVMTLSEASIYTFFQNAILVWTALFFLWKVQTIHNYSVYETFINILWTLFAMIVFAVLIFITYGISSDLKDFIVSIFKEVAIR